jgi:5-dehydro-2-deoxygluconokinase
MAVGFDQPLYVLPFDHRGTFQKNMFGWTGALTPEQTAEIAAAKQVIYDALKAAVAGGVGGAAGEWLLAAGVGVGWLAPAERRGGE